MMLTIRTIKRKKNSDDAERKDYRFAEFDNSSAVEGLSFEQKFNRAEEILKEEIRKARENNDMAVYEPIQIVDVFLS